MASSGLSQAYFQTLMPLTVPRTARTRIGLELGVDCLSQYLFEELREKRGLVYGAGASLYWELPGQVFLQCRTATDMDKLDKTQRAFREAINSFTEHGLSTERINNIKVGEVRATVNAQEDIDCSASWLWDAFEEGMVSMDPFDTQILAMSHISVESIRTTTRLHVLGKDKLGKLVGS